MIRRETSLIIGKRYFVCGAEVARNLGVLKLPVNGRVRRPELAMNAADLFGFSVSGQEILKLTSGADALLAGDHRLRVCPDKRDLTRQVGAYFGHTLEYIRIRGP